MERPEEVILYVTKTHQSGRDVLRRVKHWYIERGHLHVRTSELVGDVNRIIHNNAWLEVSEEPEREI